MIRLMIPVCSISAKDYSQFEENKVNSSEKFTLGILVQVLQPVFIHCSMNQLKKNLPVPLPQNSSSTKKQKKHWIQL